MENYQELIIPMYLSFRLTFNLTPKKSLYVTKKQHYSANICAYLGVKNYY